MLFLFGCPGAHAQPRCSPQFNPFEDCSYRSEDKYIFFGRVVSIESVRDESIPRSQKKVIVEVERTFKGSLKETAEVYLDFRKCSSDPVYQDEQYVFTAQESSAGNSTILISESWSFGMKEYADEDKTEIFSVIAARAEFPKAAMLRGAVVTRKQPQDFRASTDKTTFKLGYNPDSFEPLAGIAVEARRRRDGKIFRVKTDQDGSYIFKNLADGDYQVDPILPEGYHRASYAAGVGDAFCQTKKIFEIKTGANLSGRISVPAGEITRYSVLVLLKMDDGGNIVETNNAVNLPDQSIPQTGSQYTLDFYFPVDKSGRYFLELRYLKRNSVYFPGVKEKNNARPIDLEVGKDTIVDFTVR